jgi:cell division protein ZapA (FtsZ GTPase activity inhibitor)
VSEKRAVTVRIRGQDLRIRSDEDPARLERIARHVDETMAEVQARTGTVDTLDVAMLTSLNLAREALDAGEARRTQARLGDRLRVLIELAESAIASESH